MKRRHNSKLDSSKTNCPFFIDNAVEKFYPHRTIANLAVGCYSNDINAPASRKARWGFRFYRFGYTEDIMRTIVFIDGENFRKSIQFIFDNAKKQTPIWYSYDFKGLFDKVLIGIEIHQVIFYFSKLQMHPETPEKSKQLIEERRLLKTALERKGYIVMIAGRVRGHMERVRGFLGRTKEILTFKEKGVDVKIAVDMVTKACDGVLQQAILGSSDSDLQPAIQELRKRKVFCIYLGFENEPNKGLTATTNRTILIRNAEVLGFGQKKA